MTIAEFHGKARELESTEDALTSSVFGTLRYIPVDRGLISLLETSLGFETSQPAFPKIRNVTATSYFFWPRGALRSREPDLVIVLRTCGRPVVICVEAKLHSGKHNTDGSAEDDHDGEQLADQWEEMIRGAIRPRSIPRDQDPGEEILKALDATNAEKHLLYVTAHYAPPVEHFEETMRSLEARNLRSTAAGRLFWTSWYRVLPVPDGLLTDRRRGGCVLWRQTSQVWFAGEDLYRSAESWQEQLVT